MKAAFEIDLIQLFLAVCGSAAVAILIVAVWYLVVNYRIVRRDDYIGGG